MATTKKAKTANTTVKNAATTKKKSKTQEQIEKLEKALENVKEEDVINLVPEDVKADIEADKEAADAFENPQDINFDDEVKKILETAEPSEEVKQQVEEFETGKEEFNKKIAEKPEKAEEVVKAEIKRIENIKKKAEALRANIQKQKLGNEGFTNWWNGSSGLY